MILPKTFDSLPDIQIVQVEEYTKQNYFYDNLHRTLDVGVVIQQTIAGSAFFENHQGRKWAGKGQAMIFGYPEESRYGLDELCQLPYRLRWTHISGGEGVKSIASEIREKFGSVVKMAEKGEAGQLLQKIHEDFQTGNMRDRLYLADYAYRMLIALYREQLTDSQGKDPISYGKHLLETQFRSSRNLKEWAGEIGVSREHFTREFHARYGETPAHFLRKLRLRYAKILLENKTLTLEDVANISGFASPQTFHRAYKTMYGEAAGKNR